MPMKFKLLKESTELQERLITEANLFRDMLTEDKSVKFNGQVYPKFGWCVILCGGSGSGKSTAYKYLIPIDAKKYDVDALKTSLLGAKDKEYDKYKIVRSELNGDKIILRNGQEISLEGIPEPYNLSNSEFTELIHKATRPLSKKVKQSFLDIGKNASKDRLPNIVFDITGKDVNDIEEIISAVKPIGYKVALVWVMGDIEQAISQNETRFRQVPKDLLIQIHWDVIKSLTEIATTRELFDSIDDFYVILQTVFNLKDPEQRDKYINMPNVYKIESRKDVANFPDIIKDMVEKNRKTIISKYSEFIVDKSQ